MRLIKTLITVAHVAGLDETMLRTEPARQKKYMLEFTLNTRCRLGAGVNRGQVPLTDA